MAQGAKLRRKNSKMTAKRQKRHADRAKQMKVGKRRIKAKNKDQKQLNYEVCSCLISNLLLPPECVCSIDQSLHLYE